MLPGATYAPNPGSTPWHLDASSRCLSGCRSGWPSGAVLDKVGPCKLFHACLAEIESLRRAWFTMLPVRTAATISVAQIAKSLINFFLPYLTLPRWPQTHHAYPNRPSSSCHIILPGQTRLRSDGMLSNHRRLSHANTSSSEPPAPCAVCPPCAQGDGRPAVVPSRSTAAVGGGLNMAPCAIEKTIPAHPTLRRYGAHARPGATRELILASLFPLVGRASPLTSCNPHVLYLMRPYFIVTDGPIRYR
ncbi:hypothetical protein F5Y05DRAFT_395847 [Hypoxylon sp. FL0543]|nr:hypothetical protein F5Y05DRAFT_395847 [Hypoxylon sp. FL0543]